MLVLLLSLEGSGDSGWKGKGGRGNCVMYVKKEQMGTDVVPWNTSPHKHVPTTKTNTLPRTFVPWYKNNKSALVKLLSKWSHILQSFKNYKLPLQYVICQHGVSVCPLHLFNNMSPEHNADDRLAFDAGHFQLPELLKPSMKVKMRNNSVKTFYIKKAIYQSIIAPKGGRRNV